MRPEGFPLRAHRISAASIVKPGAPDGAARFFVVVITGESIMCIGSFHSSSSMPSAPPPPPAPIPAPQLPDQGVQQAGSDQRKRAMAAMGPAGTIQTTPAGLTDAPQTTAKTLLGS
jgi:hypothetical protein